MMNFYYITLPNKQDRQKDIESSFKKHFPKDAFLQKVEAVDTQYVKDNNIVGKVTEVERAVFTSHMKAVRLASDQDSHVAIFEDDTIFFPGTYDVLNNVMNQLGDDNWDIIYGDVTIRYFDQMVSLLSEQKQLRSSNKVSIKNMKTLPMFCGAMSYVINKKYIPKLIEIADANSTSIDAAYDEFLRILVERELARSFCIFPFITHMSELGNYSQVQEGEQKLRTDYLWGMFRRLCWMGRSPEDLKKIINQGTGASLEAQAIGKFIQNIFS